MSAVTVAAGAGVRSNSLDNFIYPTHQRFSAALGQQAPEAMLLAVTALQFCNIGVVGF